MNEYISRQETIKEIKSRIFFADDAWESGYNTAMAEIAEWIKHTPSADVQPVKHGKWLPSDSYIITDEYTIHCHICSECGADLMEDDDYDYNFCPVCGAKMDGDSEC